MIEKNSQLIPLILCGGSGSRLWPLSRKSLPKACMPFVDQSTLVEKTYQRACALVPPQQVYFATQGQLKPWFEKQNVFGMQNFIFEPAIMNTAASILLSALVLRQKHGENASMLVLPADHLISPLDQFTNAIEQIYEAAQQGRLLTLGLKVRTASVDYGYIKTAERLAKNLWTVDCFIEKPNQTLAQEFLAQDNYFWNSGIFCFQICTIINAFQQHCPEFYAAAVQCWQQTAASWPIQLDPSSKNLPKTSLDYAIMEKAQNIAVVPVNFDWQDIGNWQSYSQLWPTDAHGNRIVGKALLEDVKDSVLYSPNKLVATLGVKDLVIINTEDALLILPKSRLKDIKKLYAKLSVVDPDLL